MRILSLTLVLLISFGCSKDEDTKTKASTSPLVATWQLDDLKIEGDKSYKISTEAYHDSLENDGRSVWFRNHS